VSTSAREPVRTAQRKSRAALVFVGLALLTLLLVFAYGRLVWPLTGAFGFELGGARYELQVPHALGALLLAPLVLGLLYRSLADLPWQQRLLSALFRLGFIALLALGLSRPARQTETARVCSVFLIDLSDSVSDAALDDAQQLLVDAGARKRPDDLLKVIGFARRPHLLPFGEQGELPNLRAARGPAGSEQGGDTNLEAALQLAYGVFPPGYVKHAVLVSDGVETKGDLLAESNRAQAFGVKLSTVPYRRPVPAEVAVQSLEVPGRVKVGQPFTVVAQIYASQATAARARLYQGEVQNGLDGVKNLELTPGNNEVRFESVVRVGGEVTYKLALDRLATDQFAQNNEFTTSVEVPGRPQVLFVEGQPQRASYLQSALSAQQFDVDVRAPTALPRSLAELERYDLFILSDVPAEAVDADVQDLIERYVRDLGGGFVFAGGEAGYGLGGWNHTTIERLLPVRMDNENRKDMPGVAMALVIDRSGSMTGLPIEMAKAACRATVETLRGDDLVEVIAFDSRPKRFVKLQPARYSGRIMNEIATIQPGGGTAIFPALDAAYQDISVAQARKKHVVLLSDGRADSQGIRDLVAAMIAESITVTTVGLGDGADADLLRLIADAGGGRYHHVPDPTNLPRIFTRETEMITRQSAVQEWFPVRQTSGADFLRGIDLGSAPMLHGYVATRLKPTPAQQILVSDQGEPILARWRVGLGWAVAWTSDIKNNWSVDWLRWSAFGRFWGQLVREHMRTKERHELDMKTELVGGHVKATVDAFTPDGRFDNLLQSRLFVTGPLPGNERREITMRQVAPGRYQSDFDLDAYGSFLLRAEHNRVGDDGQLKPFGTSLGRVSQPYPREYASFEPNEALLRNAAAAARGDFAPSAERYFEPGDAKVVYHEGLWQRFILLALICFFLDLLMRRVRLFDRGFSRG
jgi:Ca-activated chloride channel family protein